MSHYRPKSRRLGAIAPLTAIMLVPLLGMLAFAVDMSWIILVRQELQNAADAGALAAARSLQAGYVQYNMAATGGTIRSYTDAAITEAQRVVQKNSAGGRTLVFNTANVSQNRASYWDIEFGQTDSSGNYIPYPSYPPGDYPNTVKVQTFRNTDHGASLGLFFGAMFFGRNTIDLSASAGATLQSGTVSPPTSTAGLSGSDAAGILPLAYNINWWNNFLATGKNPDGTTASKDANGTPYLTAFGGGGSSNALGQANWGWLSLDDSHNGASTLSGWVDSGMSSTDYTALKNANLFPLSLHDSTQVPTSSSGPSGSFNWLGDNGAKVSVAHTINDYVGKTFLIPLYQPVTAGAGVTLPNGVSVGDAGIGKSNSFYYNIVQFVPVKIISTGDNNSVAIAPTTNLPPGTTATSSGPASTPAPNANGGTTAVTQIPVFTPPKLTQ